MRRGGDLTTGVAQGPEGSMMWSARGIDKGMERTQPGEYVRNGGSDDRHGTETGEVNVGRGDQQPKIGCTRLGIS